MKKKHGINIMFFVFIYVLFMNLSCSSVSKEEKEGILLKTDRDFSGMSVKEGMIEAFLFYIAEDGVILRDNSYPSKGRETLRQYYSGRSDTSFILSWDPVFEKISESGDLGYTYGIWTNTIRKTGEISRGTYLTIWQKQTEGSWKFVLDSGTQGLPAADNNL